MPGVVLRVSSTLHFVPSTTDAYSRASVATPRKALEKIQSHSLTLEQCAGETSDGGDAIPFLKVVAVFVEKR